MSNANEMAVTLKFRPGDIVTMKAFGKLPNNDTPQLFSVVTVRVDLSPGEKCVWYFCRGIMAYGDNKVASRYLCAATDLMCGLFQFMEDELEIAVHANK